MGNEKWRCDSWEGQRYSFYGMSADVADLPKDAGIGTGSTAYCVDTGAVYMFFQPELKWYEQ